MSQKRHSSGFALVLWIGVLGELLRALGKELAKEVAIGTLADKMLSALNGWLAPYALAIAVTLVVAWLFGGKIRRMTIPVFLMASGGAIFAIGAIWHFGISPPLGVNSVENSSSASELQKSPNEKQSDQNGEKTLEDYFESDFDGRSFQWAGYSLSPDASEPEATWRMYFDEASGTRFMALFVPVPMGTANTHQLISSFPDLVPKILEEFDKNTKGSIQRAGEISATSFNEMPLSNVIYIYYENALTLEQITGLTQLYRDKGEFRIQLRGPAYLAWKRSQENDANGGINGSQP